MGDWDVQQGLIYTARRFLFQELFCFAGVFGARLDSVSLRQQQGVHQQAALSERQAGHGQRAR